MEIQVRRMDKGETNRKVSRKIVRYRELESYLCALLEGWEIEEIDNRGRIAART